jgi:hypothetical protein
LQPNQEHSTTTWSRSVFPSGGNVARSSHPVAQRLRKIHRTIERRMEMQQKNTLSAAALKIKLARKLLQKNPPQPNSIKKLDATKMTTDVDTDNTDTVTTTMNEEDDVPDYGSSVEWIEEDRPVSEFEQVLLQEERQVAQQRQALYAQKWSLDRAKRLFGTDTSSAEMENDDAVLQRAARDVYTCYELLCHAGPTLQLPVTLIEEAAGWLCQYAARRDGFKVKGIAITSGARSTAEEKLKLREAHRLRQMAALCAASVFWIARERQRPRTLLAVCQSIRFGNATTVARKHCSRALQELKRCFPSFAPVPAAISCIQNGVAEMQQDPKDTTWSRQIDSIRSRVEHSLHPLQLPPVAEAAIRYLVVMRCCEDPLDHAIEARKLATRCAALSYLVCSAGRTLQRLAQQTQAQPTAPQLWSGRAASSGKDVLSVSSQFTRPDTDDMDEEENENMAEQRAYEMRRMWDAWAEQLPWERSGRSLESAKTALLEEYQQRVFPQRTLLLQALRDAVQEKSTTEVEMEEVASVLELERVLLEKTPLAPTLLSHIAMAAPLMKMDLQL